MKPDGSIAQQDPSRGTRAALLQANDPGEASAMMRLLFAVVTEDIFVADGSKSETFLAVGEIKPGASMPNYVGYTPMPAAPNNNLGSAAAGAAKMPPQRSRKLRLLEVEMHRRAADLYQDDDFKRGLASREIIDKVYSDATDNYMEFMSKDQNVQDDIQNNIHSLLNGASGHWLWRFLFRLPDQNNSFTSDAIARIRRVSPPIEMLEQTELSS
jgi:hypothetical protein